MSWRGVITNAGQELLNQWAVGGHLLTIDGASVGSGITPEANMRIATSLVNEQDTADIISVEAVEGGTKFKIQVGPTEDTEYLAREIGIWAHIGSGNKTLLALHEDIESGIGIPTKATSPDFAFALYVTHAISNEGTLSVTINPNAYVSQSTFDELVDSFSEMTTETVDTIWEQEGVSEIEEEEDEEIQEEMRT